MLNGAAVADVICSAPRALTDESRFSALAFQKPGAATEGEALQFRGHDAAVAHGAYCVPDRRRYAAVLPYSANPSRQNSPPTVVKLQPPSSVLLVAVVLNQALVSSPVVMSLANASFIRRVEIFFELGRGGSAWLGMLYDSASPSGESTQPLSRNSLIASGLGINVPTGRPFNIVTISCIKQSRHVQSSTR